jgi:CO/xanthine dehydrogenase Mo-binding subunit
VASAIEDALGIHVTRVPATPERLMIEMEARATR